MKRSIDRRSSRVVLRQMHYSDLTELVLLVAEMFCVYVKASTVIDFLILSVLVVIKFVQLDVRK